MGVGVDALVPFPAAPIFALKYSRESLYRHPERHMIPTYLLYLVPIYPPTYRILRLPDPFPKKAQTQKADVEIRVCPAFFNIETPILKNVRSRSGHRM